MGHPLDELGFMRWFERYRPDAVISLTTMPRWWLSKRGYRVPEDVAFSCLNVRDEECVSGSLIQVGEVAARTVDCLTAAMREHRYGLPLSPEAIRLAPKWNEGNTLPLLARESRSRSVG